MRIADVVSAKLWFDLQKQLLGFVRDLPDDAFDWRWRSDQWSIADQIAHIVEVRDWWLDHNVLGNPRREDLVDEREGQAPERRLAAERSVLTEALTASYVAVETCLARPADDLQRLVQVAGRKGTREIAVAWIVPHTLEHDSHHQGQATLLRRLHLAGIKGG